MKLQSRVQALPRAAAAPNCRAATSQATGSSSPHSSHQGHLLTAMAPASHGLASTAAAAPSCPEPVSGTTTVSSEPLTSAAAQGSLMQRCLPEFAASLPQCQWHQPGDCCCCLLLAREDLQWRFIMLSCLTMQCDPATLIPSHTWQGHCQREGRPARSGTC